MTIKGRDYPLQDATVLATTTVTQSTGQSDIRARSRHPLIRIESTGEGYGWRLGTLRLDVRQDGRRCNRSGSAITFRVSVHVEGASADDKQFLFYNQSLAASTTQTVVIGICLGQKDVVKVYVSAVNVSFNLFGVETS